jgi:hypothetical protein
MNGKGNDLIKKIKLSTVWGKLRKAWKFQNQSGCQDLGLEPLNIQYLTVAFTKTK